MSERVSGAVRYGVLALASSVLCGCSKSVLEPAGPIGIAERTILFNALAIMLAIVVPVILATIGFAVWFRRSNTRAAYWPEWEFSGRIELIVWSIPILIIIFLGGIAWFGSHDLDPNKQLASKEKPLEIQVVSLDWKWLFIYPEQDVAAVNELFIPTGRPVTFKITSATVWNTFFVPQLGGMIYSMAGMVNQLNLQADRPGTYRGISGMFSGAKFADMHFEVHAVDDQAFSTWVTTAKASAQKLDTDGYAKLAQTGDTAPVSTFKSVEPKLFEAIVAETAPAPAGRPNITNP